jgi:Fe-S-cluster containining protein
MLLPHGEVLMNQLPCSSCTALCCGPVPIFEARLEQTREHLRALSIEERERLASQQRGEFDCGFLDKDNYRCTIYPLRPYVCEAFGHVKGMVCPQIDRLVQIIPAMTEEARLKEEMLSPIAATSDCWNWKRMDFVND